MYPEGSKNILKLIVGGFTKTSQRHPVLNLENRNRLISILVENLLSDIKKQTEDDVGG